MKTILRRLIPVVVILLMVGLRCRTASASVLGVNAPGTSYSTIQFVDVNSLNPSLLPGTTSLTQTVTPWNGTVNSLALTTDPVTGDSASGDIAASVVAGNYWIALNNVVLNQPTGNSGYADLIFQFSVEYQLSGAGLAIQPTWSPTFLINGTVQNAVGSFASVTGWINYFGTDITGVYSNFETVNYNALYNTPGSFSASISGTPTVGTTPALAGNTTLTLVGYLDFRVDPASFSLETAPVPEPGSLALLGLGCASLIGFRRSLRK